MPIDWTPFVEFVRRHHRFLITTHVRPDGDALGSQFAMAEALERLGKQVRRVIASRLPPRYGFMDPGHAVRVFEAPGDEFRDCDAALVLDTGTWNQLAEVGPFLRGLPAAKFVIDHHRTQDDLGGGRIVDVTAEACGRLTRDAIRALGVPLTETMASHLFVALAMDTGWFRHPSTTPATYGLAEELVAAGARPTVIYDHLYEMSTLPRLHLTGLALSRLRALAGGRVAHTEIHLADYRATGAVPLDTEDLVNYPRSLEGVEVALLFIEQPDGAVKVSFRSRARVDVARLAEQFGGGGHRLASGTTLPGPLEVARERVLQAAAAAVELLTTGGP